MSYVPSSDACLAFMEAAFAPGGVSPEGRAREMDVGAGLVAALAVDAPVILVGLVKGILVGRNIIVPAVLSQSDLLEALLAPEKVPSLATEAFR